MRNSIPISDITVGLTILVISTLLCFSSCVTCAAENESGLGPEMLTMRGGSSSSSASSREPLSLSPGQGGGNERFFRNYYEMLRDMEPMWKRAPAAGFFGMRGKKVPSSTFYGMRGKKGPSGFLGMRGKKSQDAQQQQQFSLNSAGEPLVDLVSVGGAGGMGGLGYRLKGMGPDVLAPGGNVLDNYEDYNLFGVTGPSAGLISAYKRAPAEGFMGLRGKRSATAAEANSNSAPNTIGIPSRSYK